MALSPQYAATPKIGVAVINTANASRDGTGALGTVFSAGASGSRIDAVEVQAISSATAGMVRLFISDGTNHRLFAEVPVTATTPSASTPAFSCLLSSGMAKVQLPIIIPSGWSLRASTEKSESFNVIAFGGDF